MATPACVRLFGLLLLMMGIVGTAASQPLRFPNPKAAKTGREQLDKAAGKPSAGPASSSGEKKTPPPAAPTVETLKLPSGAVIVISGDVKEPLRQAPARAVVLTPEEYQRMLDQIAQLKRQARPEKPVTPSSCKVTGRVEGSMAYLQVQFDFKTDSANGLIDLGCAGATPTDAKLDGALAWLQRGEDGYVIPVENPGPHEAKLELVVPVAAKKAFKGAGRGFDLELPRAAITTLEQLDLPGALSEVLLSSRTVRPRQLDAQRSRLEKVPITAAGPLDNTRRLDLTWKGPAAEPARSPTVLAAIGKLTVRIESQVLTDVELELRALSGETAVWRVLVPLPPDGVQEVKALPQDEARVQSIERSADKQGTLVTVRLKQPGAEPLRLSFRLQQPRSTSSVPIGPITVPDAMTQRGEIELRAVDEIRLHYTRRGDVGQREVSDEQRRDNVKAAFAYWNAAAAAGPPAAPFVTLQIEPVKGAVETRVTHTLRLIPPEGSTAGQWRLLTQLDVRPVRTAVDRIDLSLPPGYKFEDTIGPSSSELVEKVTSDQANQVLQIKLASKQSRPFLIKLPGFYLLQPAEQETALELPRPMAWSVEHEIQSGATPPPGRTPTLDRGGQVTVGYPEGIEPSRSLDLQENGSPRVRSLFPQTPETREFTWQTDRAPVRLTAGWRPHRAELRVDALADVTLAGRQAHVRQHLQLQFSQAPPAQLLLRVPAGLAGGLQVIEGGTLSRDDKNPKERSVVLKAPPDREQQIILQYSFALPPAREVRGIRRFDVPLVHVVQATRGESKVRVWCDPGELPELASGRWEEAPAEVVPNRESLPVLVLHGGLASPLALKSGRAGSPVLASAAVERVLAHAFVDEGTSQSYQVRFLLSKLTTRHLDVQLPVALTTSNVQVSLDGVGVPLRMIDEAGQEVEVGKIVRLKVDPELYPKPVDLAVSYQIDPSRLEGNGRFLSTLRPPTLTGAIFMGRVRWQVDLPAGDLAVYALDGSLEERWCWSNWLFRLRPAATSEELERWFKGEGAKDNNDAEPAALCWQSTLGPLPLVHVPQRFWLLICAFVFLAVALVLFFAPLPRFLFWVCVLLLGAAIAGMGVIWPGILSVVAFGCQLPVVVLLLLVGFQWTLHQRYRRQVVFMPGFTRLKPGSSLAPAGSSHRKRELSTVDEPPKRGSSLTRAPKA
ncbi:MAG TPA: hypothetical protein VKI17_01020 [Gemmataceae bacterium]|nr:hypothetical protein [Gemmataceae bacterium]